MPATAPAAFRPIDVAGQCDQIVFAIDTGYDTRATFNEVRTEVLQCIGHLKPSQTFNIVIISAGRPVELSPMGLIPSDTKSLKKAAEFLSEHREPSQINPLPGLSRAYDFLDKGDAKRSKAIVLVTDRGGFADDQQVRNLFYRRDPDKVVHIYPFLVLWLGDGASKFLREVARNSDGRFGLIISGD